MIVKSYYCFYKSHLTKLITYKEGNKMRLAYITEQSSEKVKVLAMMIIKLLGNHAGSHSKAEAALEEAQPQLNANTKPVIAAPHANDWQPIRRRGRTPRPIFS